VADGSRLLKVRAFYSLSIMGRGGSWVTDETRWIFAVTHFQTGDLTPLPERQSEDDPKHRPQLHA